MSLISTPTFFASSFAASLRFGASLTFRIPWSVQSIVSMKVAMSILPEVHVRMACRARRANLLHVEKFVERHKGLRRFRPEMAADGLLAAHSGNRRRRPVPSRRAARYTLRHVMGPKKRALRVVTVGARLPIGVRAVICLPAC